MIKLAEILEPDMRGKIQEIAQKFGFTNVRIYRSDEGRISSLRLLVDLDEESPKSYRNRNRILATYLGQEKMLNCHVVVTCDSRSNMAFNRMFGEDVAIPIDEVNKVRNLWQGENAVFSKLDISQMEDLDKFEHELHEQRAIQLGERFIKEWEQKRAKLVSQSVSMFGTESSQRNVERAPSLSSSPEEELTDIIWQMPGQIPKEAFLHELRSLKSEDAVLFGQFSSFISRLYNGHIRHNPQDVLFT